MIELKQDELSFSFPEVHPDAKLSLNLQRTLRIPDDGDDYPLPPGLGAFPLRHVDDFATRLPELWKKHGGVMLPMYQSEALWLSLSGHYPFAVKIATGKINAITGESWTDGIHRDPQDYMVTPDQPWLDGYCVEKGTIRQFVAMPLGGGYTVEEQITGAGARCLPRLQESPSSPSEGLRIFISRSYVRSKRAFHTWHLERDLALHLSSWLAGRVEPGT